MKIKIIVVRKYLNLLYAFLLGALSILVLQLLFKKINDQANYHISSSKCHTDAEKSLDDLDNFFIKIGNCHKGKEIQKFIVEYLEDGLAFETACICDEKLRNNVIEKYSDLEETDSFYFVLLRYLSLRMYDEIHSICTEHRITQYGSKELTQAERESIADIVYHHIKPRINKLRSLITDT